MGSMEIYEGQTINLNKNILSRNGYDFAGWSTSGDNNVVYADEGRAKSQVH